MKDEQEIVGAVRRLERKLQICGFDTRTFS